MLNFWQILYVIVWQINPEVEFLILLLLIVLCLEFQELVNNVFGLLGDAQELAFVSAH